MLPGNDSTTPAPSRPPHSRRLPRSAVAVGVLTLATVSVFLMPPIDGTRTGLVVDDVGELVVAALAAGAAAWRAGRQKSTASTWRWIAAGCASWTIGEAVWSYYELWHDVTVPFPSPADVGFLLLPIGICAALLRYPTAGAGPQRARRVLDALMTTASIALVGWATTLSAVLQAGAADRFSLGVSLAYPVLDLGVLVLTVLTVSRVRTGTLPLWLLASGVVALSVSDSAFAYLAAAEHYTGGLVDLGWFAGFVLLTLAALAHNTTSAPAGGTAVPGGGSPVRTLPSYLPYLPVVIALAVTLTLAVAGQAPSTAELLLAAAVVALLLARQYLALQENVALSDSLTRREAELHHQAFHDSLTGLANRALFADRLTHALALHARDLRPVAVLFLDLDDFKVVNDTLGHGAGDQLLTRVAERLVGSVRYGDTVARLGGDEFAVLMEDGGDATVMADKVCNSLQAPFQLGADRVAARASIGVFTLTSGESPISADELLARADTAMYAAKRAGKGQVALYGEGMVLDELIEQHLTTAFTRAMRDGGLRAQYQPVVDVHTGAIRGLEALARWDCDGRAVPPETFIPIAERAGLLTELTDRMLRRAGADLASWCRQLGRSDLWVAVNAPPAQVAEAAFTPLVQEVLHSHGLVPAQLVIELTESGTFPDLAAGRTAVARLRQLGVRVSLDDFGTGYSTLAQLGDMPLDMVKVDRSFVSRLDTDPRQARFLDALLRLADDLQLEVIVEGIERPAQFAVLRATTCPLAQGFLLHRPMNAAGVVAVLLADRRDVPVSAPGVHRPQ